MNQMNNINHLSRGVSKERVEEFKRQANVEEKPLILKKIVYGCFGVTLAILLLIAIF